MKMSEETKVAQATPEATTTHTQTSVLSGEQTNATLPSILTEAPAQQKQESPQTEPKDTPKETKSVVPEKYDLKLPEGSALDRAYLDKIAEYAKTKGLSNQDAQALVERDNSLMQWNQQNTLAAMQNQADQWAKQLQDDPEFGGAMFKANCEHAKRAVERFGNDELREAIKNPYIGNNPAFVKFCQAIGSAMSNDSFVRAGEHSHRDDRSFEDRFYGTK